jgi:hypothetical protein
MNAVRWRTPARDIAALVTDAGKEVFAAELFHFGEKPRAMAADLFLLAPGDFDWKLETKSGALSEGELEVSGPTARMVFTLPPGELCTLRVTRR